MKTFWLSFADTDGFLGACVLDVEDEDAQLALDLFPEMHDKVKGPWIVAATRKAHQLGINPGGEVASVELPPEVANLYPKNELLSKLRILAVEAQHAPRHH